MANGSGAVRIDNASRARMTDVPWQSQLDTLLELSTEGLFLADGTGTILYCGPSVERVTGYSAAELVGRSGFDMVDSADVPLALEVLQRAVEKPGQQVPFTLRVRRKDGSQQWVEGTCGNHLHNPAVRAVVVNYRDLTEKRLAAEALRTSEERYQSLVENLPVSLFCKGRDGRFTFVNQRFCDSFGKSRDEVVGKRDDDFSPPELVQAYRCDDALVMESNSPLYKEERFQPPAGKSQFVQVIKVPMHDREGQVTGVQGIFWDITARRSAEAEATRVTGLLHAVANETTDAVFVKDTRGKYLLCNPAAARFVGLTPEEMIGKDDTALFDPEGARMVMAMDRRVMDSGLTACNEERVAVNGVNVVFQSTKAPYRLPDGSIAGVIGIARDISDRKKADELLRSSEERFRALIEHGFEGINVVDERLKLVYASPGNHALLGYTAAEVQGRHVSENIHPDDLPEARAVQTYIERNPGQVCYARVRFRHKNGSWRWMELSVRNLLHHPAIRGAVINWRDVTDHKLAEEKLRESENRLQAILDAEPECVKLLAADGTVLEMNPAGLAIIEAESASQVFGQCIYPLIVPEHRAAFQAIAEGAFAGQSGNLEFECVTLKGNRRWLDSHVAPLRDASGTIVAALSVTRDITDRKRAEQERQRLEAQVQHAQKLESLGVMAGGIAHDFNNLLTVVLGYARLALGQLPADSPAAGMLRESERAAQRAADLTRQMLAYSGKGLFAIELLRLDRLVEELADLLGSVISKKAVLELKLEAATMAGGASQIRQVVMNLLTNASDALGDQVGHIRVRTGVAELTAAELRSRFVPDAVPAGRYAFLEVEDTGCGMSDDTLDKIFDPFFTTKFAGRGLGLAALLGIVRGHRGSIQVRSMPGRGTLFQVLFPAVAEVPAIDNFESDSIALAPPGDGLVLVIDDEPAVRLFVEQALAQAGYQVCDSADGVEGLQVFAERQAEIVAVLVDLTMPRMDGLEVLRLLRRLDAAVPILAMSGYNEEDVAMRLASAGASDFIQKPFHPGDLVARVGRLLATRKLRA